MLFYIISAASKFSDLFTIVISDLYHSETTKEAVDVMEM